MKAASHYNVFLFLLYIHHIYRPRKGYIILYIYIYTHHLLLAGANINKQVFLPWAELMKLHFLPRQVPKAKLSNTSWAPTDLFWPGAFVTCLPHTNSQKSNKTQACTEPFPDIYSYCLVCWLIPHFHEIYKNWASSKSLSLSQNCQNFALCFFSFLANTDCMKGPHLCDMAP